MSDGEGRIDAYSSPERGGFVLRFDTVMMFREREVGSTATGAAWERKACRERNRKQANGSMLIDSHA